MSIESLLIAAEYLDAKAQGSNEPEPGPSTSFCNSPPSNSSSNDSLGQRRTKSPTRRGRRPENNRMVNREVHNKLEKNRRAQMKEGFENLKKLLPNVRNSKISSLALLKEVRALINDLKDEEETLREERGKLYTKHVALKKQRHNLKDGFYQEHGFHLQEDIKQNTEKRKVKEGTESTTTASEGDEMEEHEEVRRFRLKKRSHSSLKLSDLEKKQLLVGNASRPSVVMSSRDRLYSMPSDKKKPHILYTQLSASSSTIPVQSISDETSLLSLEAANAAPCSSFSSQAAAECLLQLSFKNDAPLKEEGAVNNHILNRNDQPAFYRKQILRKNSVLDREKSEKYKPVRKRNLGSERKVVTSDSPKSKVRVLSSEHLIVKDPTATGVASSSESENGKESILAEDKAKFILAFRPGIVKSTTKNTATTIRPPVVSNSCKQVVTKFQLNTNRGKVASPDERYQLISDSQVNPASLDNKSPVMILENELKFISCKPVVKQESASKSTDLKVVTGSKNLCGNSTIAACSERLLIQDGKAVLKMDVKGTSDIKIGTNGSIPIVSDKNSHEVIYQVMPTSGLPPIGLVLSSMGNNRTLPEMQFRVASQKSQQDITVQKVLPSSHPTNNVVVDHARLLNTNQPHNFGIHTNNSKLYVITVPNLNKTIHQNGKNV